MSLSAVMLKGVPMQSCPGASPNWGELEVPAGAAGHSRPGRRMKSGRPGLVSDHPDCLGLEFANVFRPLPAARSIFRPSRPGFPTTPSRSGRAGRKRPGPQIPVLRKTDRRVRLRDRRAGAPVDAPFQTPSGDLFRVSSAWHCSDKLIQ